MCTASLPDFVIKELDALTKKSDRHWFWTANCKLKTAVTDWQARLPTLFENAKVTNGHAQKCAPVPRYLRGRAAA